MRVPYQNPAPGTSPIADAIRLRRGARGLTPLDQALLNAPHYAVRIMFPLDFHQFLHILDFAVSLPRTR